MAITSLSPQVLRHVVKEMLTLEENIPWDGVENYWKVREELLCPSSY